MKTASCLCGGVAIEISGPLRAVLACHCTQCRKQTGNYVATTSAKLADVKFTRNDNLHWYRSSSFAKRGFCGTCGSFLFWQRDDSDSISIAAGAIDGPTGLALDGHIYCTYAGDYYEITGGKYQKGEW
jgi:hypothetical protein